MNERAYQPIVCDLTAVPADEREAHVTNSPRIFQAAQEIRELPNGYAFRLPNEDGMWMALATFVAHERRCCPFWRFGLTVEPSNGPFWLELTGPEGAKALLATALGEQSGEDLFKQLIHTDGESGLDQAVAQAALELAGVINGAAGTLQK